MPPAATVASQSPSERVSLQGVPHECSVANEWTVMRVASHARILFQADERQATRPLSVESSVEPKATNSSLELSAKPPWSSSTEPSVEPSSAKPSFELSRLLSTEPSVEPLSAGPSLKPSSH